MFEDIKLRWLTAAALLVTTFEVFSLSGISLPFHLAFPLYTLIILAIGHDILWKGVIALKNFNFKSINLLLVIAVIGAYYLEQYPEAAVVIVLFSLAEHLEDIGIARSKASLERLVDQMPQWVHLKGEEFPADVNTVIVGQKIVVKPFQTIPLDGKVIEGTSFVDESSITGEPVPQEKNPGSEVFAGTLNRQGVLEIEVTKTQKNSIFSRIREATFEALAHKAETQKFIESFSRYYTPAIILLALFWMTIPWLFFGVSFEKGFAEALMLLVIACPCALVISTPISIYSAIGAASTAGIVIKGGAYLETVGKVNWIALDKTRTLTYGNPIVTDVVPGEGRTRAEVLSCAAALELFSEHPLAQSIVRKAREENLTLHEVSNYESLVGKGGKATCHLCQQQEHYIGKVKGFQEDYPLSEDLRHTIERLQSQGKTVILLSTRDRVEGLIALRDEVRPEAALTIATLTKQKIKTIMLTGDQFLSAQSVAKEVQVDRLESECLPEDKTNLVRLLQREGSKVAMVGDGINDAPALAQADVGISMSKLASDTAVETASIVILNDHLMAVPYLVNLGRRTLSIIKFNTFFAIAIKLVVIALALSGVTNLALAIFADVGVTLLVILNSLRLRLFNVILQNTAKVD